MLASLLSVDANQENVPPRANTSVITANELKKIREQISTGAQNNASVSVINKSDLDRIRKEVIIKDAKQAADEKKLMGE